MDWINSFNNHILSTYCVLAAGPAEMKDNGEVVLHPLKVGQLEDSSTWPDGRSPL